MKPTNILHFLFLIVLTNMHAQQSPQYSQYMLNPIVINPAITGAENYMDITLGVRNQWTGFEAAPKTGTLSFNAPTSQLFSNTPSRLDATHSGIGGFIYADKAGPISLTGAFFNYAYHLKFSENWFLSVGTSVGFTQFKFDDSNVVLVQQPTGDPLIQNISNNNFDMSLGMYAYTENFFVGISSNHIFDSDIQYSNIDGVVTSGKINRNYNFLLGSRMAISKRWKLVPSFLLKTTTNAPVQLDLNTKFEYDNKFWFGASYRNEESFYAMAGIRFWESFLVSYSYDTPFSKIRSSQSGTHEIVLTYRFSSGKNCFCPKYSM